MSYFNSRPGSLASHSSFWHKGKSSLQGFGMTLPDTSPSAPGALHSSGLWKLFPNGLLVFERPAGASGPSRILVSRINLCVDPKCDCRDAMMTAVSVDPDAPPSPEEMKANWNGPGAMHALIDIDSGAATPDERDGCNPLSPDWLEYLKSAVDDELLDVLHESWLDAKGDLDDAPQPPRPPAPRLGRNELCPCGSGKKFKRCCA
jgi:hypothetical protein